jgi:putative transposon-encoded protein
MFGLLTRKELEAYIAKQVKQMEAERWHLENEQDRFNAKLKTLERRIEMLEGTRPSNMLTPEEVEVQTKKRVEANRYARIQYRKRKAQNASNRT